MNKRVGEWNKGNVFLFEAVWQFDDKNNLKITHLEHFTVNVLYKGCLNKNVLIFLKITFFNHLTLHYKKDCLMKNSVLTRT